ncbi:hypothetical protein [Streptomyces sp. MK5]|uniref:hypothetical protein n=1 Tax=Streptomyces sp. MK5 TaxID=3064253 RepID=UPI0035578CF0
MFQLHGEEAPAARPSRYRGSAGSRTPSRGGVPGTRHPPRRGGERCCPVIRGMAVSSSSARRRPG